MSEPASYMVSATDLWDKKMLRWAPLGVGLLWALGYSLSESQDPVTGWHAVPCGRACAECGGRGEQLVAFDDGAFIDPALFKTLRRNGWRVLDATNFPDATTNALGGVKPCSCSGRDEPTKTRPHALPHHRLVEVIAPWRAAMDGPMEWPSEWLVGMDQHEATAPGSARAIWWRSFREWTEHGKAPDVIVLAPIVDRIAAEKETRMTRAEVVSAMGGLGRRRMTEGEALHRVRGMAGVGWSDIHDGVLYFADAPRSRGVPEQVIAQVIAESGLRVSESPPLLGDALHGLDHQMVLARAVRHFDAFGNRRRTRGRAISWDGYYVQDFTRVWQDQTTTVTFIAGPTRNEDKITEFTAVEDSRGVRMVDALIGRTDSDRLREHWSGW